MFLACVKGGTCNLSEGKLSILTPLRPSSLQFRWRDWPIFAKNNGGGKGDFLFMLTKSENRVSFKCGFWNKLPRRILSA
ncbi:hypothetical protein OWV82_014478 [Melia azedarach]|uniref:Uncharacterized protein n=1 Tax=Melia azedarach TaxID=155640 RepID=A0ACC1XN78_MELAZ|nr:hypothetical protein OWV82_014478 [Melia azedarach]